MGDKFPPIVFQKSTMNKRVQHARKETVPITTNIHKIFWKIGLVQPFGAFKVENNDSCWNSSCTTDRVAA
jgi:hypothetical protein